MKLKIRVSKGDFTLFAIFCALLLYLCSIATSNINSFLNEGIFRGLNPIPGLTEFIGPTLLLFFGFIIAIVATTSSSIFEFKKGFGFEIGEKEEKGYSRWAKANEIKEDTDIVAVDPKAESTDAAGIPLVNDGKKVWVDNGEYHNLIIGSTGSGKSQTVVMPMIELLMKHGESMIITDPKAEIFEKCSGYMKERGYNVVVLNFREPTRGNAWNPLTLPYLYYKDGNYDKATELLDDVAANILSGEDQKDPFWEKSSADYFSGLALGLFQDAKEDEINLNSINLMSTVGEEKFGGNSTYIKEYFKMKGESSNAYIFASNTINAPQETKGGILSTFRQKIRLFSTRENLSEMLSHSDFDMRDIGKKKTAVFIVIHDEKTTYHSLATIFIKQCYETLIDVAQKNGGKLPYRTNFILDEFANMPKLKDVTTMVTAARSRKIRFTFIIQNFAQLKDVYGDNDAETIKGNCGNMVYLISTELAALEEISKMCGEVKSGEKDKTASTPLVTVTDLQKMKLFETILIRWRLSPFRTKNKANFEMDWGHEKFDAEFPTREPKEIKYFEVKEFVKDKKRDNMLNTLNGEGGDSPSPFGGMGGDPFGASPFSANPFGGMGGLPPRFGGAKASPFGGPSDGGLNDADIDKIMADIDRRIAELDAEEAAEKAKKEAEAKAKETVPEVKEEKETEPKEEVKEEYNIPEEPKEVKKEEKEANYFDFKPIEPVNEKPARQQLNIYDSFDDDDVREEDEIKVDGNKTNVAVATKSPEEDFNFFNDNLPKVENADIVQPVNVSNVKLEDNHYNIFDESHDFMNDVKEDINTNEEVKEIKEAEKITQPVENVQPVEEETKVNIDPDSIKNDSTVISDDEFFDDFFGDE